VAKYLVERVFLTYGVPLQLLSDRGAEFEGRIFREVCEMMGVDKLRTTSYKPSTNGALERMHRTLNTMLGKMVEEKQRDWDAHVAYALAAYNATVHSSTGFSPNRLLYGRELRFPNELLYVDVEDKRLDSGSYSEFVEGQRGAFRSTFALARESLGFCAENRKKKYDMRVRPSVYGIGAWVYYFCPRHRVGRSPKWQNFYSGPYLVVEVLGAVNVRIQKSAKAAAMIVHVDKVKRCMGDTPLSWLGTGEVDTTLGGLKDEQALVPLFVEDPYDRPATVVEDDDGGGAMPMLARPKRNAPVPARYLSRVYAMAVDNDQADDVDDILCSRSDKRFAKELLEMDKEEKRLAVLEASDQERLMRQEAEDMESGGDSEGLEEYSDTRSAATDDVIYHRLLDLLDALRDERERILEERTRSSVGMISNESGSVVVVPETQEERGRKPVRIAIQDGQVLSDSDDEEDGNTPFPRGGAGARLDLGGADGSGTKGRMEGAKMLGMPSFMDVFSPRMVLAGLPPAPGLADAGVSPKDEDGRAMEGDAEEE